MIRRKHEKNYWSTRKTNSKLIELIKKQKINNFYIKKSKKILETESAEEIKESDDVLDIGKGMRDKFINIKSKKYQHLMSMIWRLSRYN